MQRSPRFPPLIFFFLCGSLNVTLCLADCWSTRTPDVTLLQLYTLRIRRRLQGQLLLLQTGIYTVYFRLFYFSSIGAKRKSIRFLPCGRQMNSALVGQGRLCVAPFQSMNNEQPVLELFLGWADWCICGRVRTNTNGDRHPKICLFQNVSDSFSNLAKERWLFFRGPWPQTAFLLLLHCYYLFVFPMCTTWYSISGTKVACAHWDKQKKGK